MPNKRDLVVSLQASYGLLAVYNETWMSYQQVATEGKLLDFVMLEARDPPLSRDKLIAIIIIICSLAFLCYFVYSWVSCYLKKPKIREDTGHEGSQPVSAQDKTETNERAQEMPRTDDNNV